MILSEEQRKKAKKQAQPDGLNPMLAKLTKTYFSDPDWIFERKLDGVRCLIFKKGKTVKLLSRNKKEQNQIYPELVEALKNQKHDFIADGEIVTFDGKITSFSKLQSRMNVQKPSKEMIENHPVWYYLFDCMHLDGYALTDLSNRERKSILKKIVNFHDPIRYCPHINERGEAFYEQACAKGWEGVIAKKASQPYHHGRSGNWLKFKCVNQQELVIGGYTPARGSREGFGAILVGFYEEGKLQYAGKVGTGFSEVELRKLKKKFEEREVKTPAFVFPVDEDGAKWINPDLVAEIGFTEWTSDNKLRHPRFLGLRHDKKAEKVIKEE